MDTEQRYAERIAAVKAKQEREREHAVSVRRWLLERLSGDDQLIEDLGGGVAARKKRHIAWNEFESEARAAGYAAGLDEGRLAGEAAARGACMKAAEQGHAVLPAGKLDDQRLLACELDDVPDHLPAFSQPLGQKEIVERW